MRALLLVTTVLAFSSPARAADPPAPTPIKTDTPGVWIEVYTDRAKFDAKLGGKVTVVDFDDVDTTKEDTAPFPTDHYKKKFGVGITGTDGQFAGRTFGYPNDYPAKSKPNSYAPGPKTGKGGFETKVTFFSGDQPAAVAGFGAVYIDADYPGLGPCALTVYVTGDRVLATDKGFSGASGSQIFRGMIAVDAQGKPVPAIRSVKLVNGNGWPANGSNEGVTLDDFAFSPPVAGELIAAAPPPPVPVPVPAGAIKVGQKPDWADKGGTIKERLVRRWSFETLGESAQTEAESFNLNNHLRQLTFEKGLAELDEAVKEFPWEPDALYFRARFYAQHQKPDSASADLKALLALKPRQGYDHGVRATAYNFTKQNIEQTHPPGEATTALVAKYRDLAIAELNEAIRLNPRYALAFYDRSLQLGDKGDREGAWRDVNKAIELAPNHPMFLYGRAVLYSDKQQIDKAVADVTVAIELAPQWDRLLRNRGIWYINLREYRKAIADFDAVIRTNPKPTNLGTGPVVADLYFHRGLCYLELGDRTAAVRDLTTSIEFDPTKPFAYTNRAAAYRGMKRLKEAAADTRKAEELNKAALPAKK